MNHKMKLLKHFVWRSKIMLQGIKIEFIYPPPKGKLKLINKQ